MREDPLVAPVQTGSDVLFDVPHAVVGQVTHQNLPPKVQDLIHYVPQPMEQIPFILLQDRERGRNKLKSQMDESCVVPHRKRELLFGHLVTKTHSYFLVGQTVKKNRMCYKSRLHAEQLPNR